MAAQAFNDARDSYIELLIGVLSKALQNPKSSIHLNMQGSSTSTLQNTEALYSIPHPVIPGEKMKPQQQKELDALKRAIVEWIQSSGTPASWQHSISLWRTLSSARPPVKYYLLNDLEALLKLDPTASTEHPTIAKAREAMRQKQADMQIGRAHV